MRFGTSMFFIDHSIAPAELARALEERGFDILLDAGARRVSHWAGIIREVNR